MSKTCQRPGCENTYETPPQAPHKKYCSDKCGDKMSYLAEQARKEAAWLAEQMKTATELDLAIIDKDVDLVALIYRRDRISEVLDAQVYGESNEAGDLTPEELILGIVAPNPELAERSLEKARQLIERGPFVEEKTCQRPDCGELFVAQGKSKAKRERHKYCSNRCRKLESDRMWGRRLRERKRAARGTRGHRRTPTSTAVAVRS